MIPNPQLSGSASNLVFLLSPETGIIITALDYTVSATREDIYDSSLGYDTGFVEYNWQIEASIKGRVTTATGAAGTSSLASVAPGGLLTLGNTLSYNGVTAGGAYCNTVAGSHGEKGFLETTVTVIKKPGIA